MPRGRKPVNKPRTNYNFVHLCKKCEIIWHSIDGENNICKTCSLTCPPYTKFVYICKTCRRTWSSKCVEKYCKKCDVCNVKCNPEIKLFYLCEDCNSMWTSSNTSTYGLKCKQCKKTVEPRPRDDCPKFGKFKCTDCNRLWMSGWAYVGYRQKCKKCKIFVEPYYIVEKDDPATLHNNKCNLKKPHESELCEKCLIGRKCVNIYIVQAI